jgi:hypothetical protein
MPTCPKCKTYFRTLEDEQSVDFHRRIWWRKIMIKKIMLDKSDLAKMAQWEQSKARKVDDMLSKLGLDKEQTYVLGFDVASENSKDYSVMVKFRLVNGRYIYEGYEIL